MSRDSSNPIDDRQVKRLTELRKSSPSLIVAAGPWLELWLKLWGDQGFLIARYHQPMAIVLATIAYVIGWVMVGVLCASWKVKRRQLAVILTVVGFFLTLGYCLLMMISLGDAIVPSSRLLLNLYWFLWISAYVASAFCLSVAINVGLFEWRRKSDRVKNN